MRQTLALFLDAYRELNAKKMFWVVLILNGLVVAAFALVGVNSGGFTLAGKNFPLPLPAQPFYKMLFSAVMIDLWLTWAAIILALISTSTIFPDFLAGGSIDLYVSKPISRLRLFITKYVFGLLFVVLQVSVFTVLCFFLLRWRAGLWEPGLFYAIPIVVTMFSYLFCVQVLLAIVTRSTVASLLLTLLFWLIICGVQFSEIRLLAHLNVFERQRDAWNQRAGELDEQIRKLPSSTQPAETPWLTANRNARDELRRKASDRDSDVRTLSMFYHVIHPIYVATPKTARTIDLLEKKLLSRDELSALTDSQEAQADERHHGPDDQGFRDAFAAARELQNIQRSRTTRSIVGSSLLFEAVALCLAAWIFHRRDF